MEDTRYIKRLKTSELLLVCQLQRQEYHGYQFPPTLIHFFNITHYMFRIHPDVLTVDWVSFYLL